MKLFFLSVAILFSFLTLILAFENLGAKTQYFLLLFTSADSIPPFFLILIITILGGITGISYTVTLLEFIKEKKGGEDSSLN